MENDPLFHHSSLTPSLDELRRLTTLRCKKIHSFNFLSKNEILQNPVKVHFITFYNTNFQIYF